MSGQLKGWIQAMAGHFACCDFRDRRPPCTMGITKRYAVTGLKTRTEPFLDLRRRGLQKASHRRLHGS